MTLLGPWLVAGLGAALGGCVAAPTRLQPVSGTPGAAGSTVVIGDDSSTGAGGAAVAMAMSSTPIETEPTPASFSCAGGATGSAMPPPIFPGIPPALPMTVTQATTPVPPISGGTLLALSDGITAFAADPDRDQVSFVDVINSKLVAQVTLQAGDEPGRAVEDAAGRVHVALRRGGAIVTLDPKTGTVSARRAVCSAPRGIAYDATTDLLHVACVGGELVSLPAAGGAATRMLTLDRDLRDVVIGANGTLLVSTFRRADVLVVGADGTVGQRLRPGSGTLASLTTGMPQVRSPAVAWRMVSYGGAAGSVVMLHQTGVDSEVDPVAGGYGGIKGCGGIAQPGVTVLTPGSALLPDVASGIEMVSLAVDIAMAPDGKTAAIAVPGNAETGGLPTIVTVDVSQMSVGNPCAGAYVVASSGNGSSSGQVIAVSYAKDGTLLAQTREPAAVLRYPSTQMGVQTSPTSVSLATDSRDDTGHLIFHVNAGGGLACASCHPEGGEDGRVWNFACTGARRTQSIRGGISATAPFHWDGAEPNFSHLMDDVFTGRMSGPALNADQKMALQSWVDTIPALPVTASLDAAAVARGQTLFTDPTYACATCHAGTLLTNNTTVDVGTGGAFQVPSLRGVAWRAPFMHTGCAATLADRFGTTTTTCDGGDKHGVTSSLTTAQVGDLVTYLQSL